MMRSDEEFEVMKARLLLIKHGMAAVETRIQTGEFGNPDTEVREERWKVSGARNNLLAPRVLAVMRSTFSELYEALDCAGIRRDREAAKAAAARKEKQCD